MADNGSILVTGAAGQLGAVERTVTGLRLDRGLPVRARATSRIRAPVFIVMPLMIPSSHSIPPACMPTLIAIPTPCPEFTHHVHDLGSELASALLRDYPTAAGFRGGPGRRVAAVRSDGAPESRRPREETSSSRKRRREGWLRAFHTYGFHPNEPNRPTATLASESWARAGRPAFGAGPPGSPPFAAAITSLAR
jgi:hypothetical protein